MNKLQNNYYLISFKAYLDSRKDKLLEINNLIKPFLIIILLLQVLNIGFNLIIDRKFDNKFTISPEGSEELTEVLFSKEIDPFKPKNTIIGNINLDQEVPPTSLPLRLYGIRYSDQGVADAAILGFDKGKQAIYSVNDVIERDTILESILKHKVVISRNGVRESVAFNDTSLISNIASYNPKSVNVVKTKPINISSQDVVSFEPYFSNGSMKGFKVFPGLNIKAFEESGLQSGDLLIAVNGISVNDPIMTVEMSNFSNQVDLDILRGENSMSLRVELN
tara:strand:+ start:2382 stop:3215 length:834 start_codon:yes stop_codon:yes gene_type:complete